MSEKKKSAKKSGEDKLDGILSDMRLPHEREFKFHPTRRWRFDFALIDWMVAIEYEGGVWTGGRHTSGTGYTKDCEKYNNAQALGWYVMRITSTHINQKNLSETKKLLWEIIKQAKRRNP